MLTIACLLAACGQDRATLGRLSCEGGLGDRDGDGVCDNLDQCPGDDLADADGDGICDALDRCPGDNTQDADGDGVCDAIDRCNGPENDLDTDGDGVCDANDRCAGADDRPDADGDGIPDCEDPCTFDGPTAPPLGTLPNEVGVQDGYFVHDISLNEGGRFLRARAGTELRVRLSFEITNCDCPGCIEQIYVGLTGEAEPQYCAYDDVPGCNQDRFTHEGTLQLPSTPGEYGIRLGHTVDFQCILPAGWQFMRNDSGRFDAIGVICVE